jgi:hypothetical protein
MPDLPTRLDYYNLGRQYVLQRAQKIDPGMVDVAGSDANLFVGSASVMADAVTKQLGYATSRLTLDGCFDEDLDRYIWDRYQLTRKGASPAVGQVRFYRASAAAGSGTIPSGTKLVAGNFEYVTTQPASFGASQLDGALANVRAVQAGKATQVGANTIQKIANAAALFDRTLFVNNDTTTAGGENQEDDDDVKARVRSFWSTAQRGTLAAIEFGALTVPGVVSAKAIEALVPLSNGLPARLVNLYIADSSGVASLPLSQSVSKALNDYRAGGIPVVVNTSIPFIQAITLSLSFAAGVDGVTLGNQIQAAVVEFVNSLPVNGTLYVVQLNSVLQRFYADGLIPNQSSLVSPAFDVVPPVGQTIRTTPANVLLTTPSS